MSVATGDRFTPFVPAGAGRSQDWNWPDNYVNAINTNCISRAGVQRVCGQTIAGGASVITATINGEDTAQLLTAAPGDLMSFSFDPVLNFHIRTSLGNDGVEGDDDFNFWRTRVRMAFGIAPTNDNAHDYGFQVSRTLGTTGFVLKDANDGWHLQLESATVVRLFVRGPNGLISTAITAAPFDTTKFHTYEMRFWGATVRNPARFQLLIDGTPVSLPTATTSWAAGTNNPSSVLTAGRTGFRPMITNFPGLANGLYVSRVKLIAAQNLDNSI
jgi:hypothetical protein